jgi:hypothetical protein
MAGPKVPAGRSDVTDGDSGSNGSVPAVSCVPGWVSSGPWVGCQLSFMSVYFPLPPWAEVIVEDQ